MTQKSGKRMYAAELAFELGRSRVYISAMKSAGFCMPGGAATLEEAMEWLRAHPTFTTTDYVNRRRDTRLVKDRSRELEAAYLAGYRARDAELKKEVS